jgi:hypothetical protein
MYIYIYIYIYIYAHTYIHRRTDLTITATNCACEIIWKALVIPALPDPVALLVVLVAADITIEFTTAVPIALATTAENVTPDMYLFGSEADLNADDGAATDVGLLSLDGGLAPRAVPRTYPTMLPPEKRLAKGSDLARS